MLNFPKTTEMGNKISVVKMQKETTNENITFEYSAKS
jgi:hypothetical protein